MAKPAIRNLQAFTANIERAKKSMKDGVTEKYRRFTTRILEDLAMNTPQWSGDLAASWQVVVGKGSTAMPNYSAQGKDTGKTRTSAYAMGSRPAVEFAIDNNEFVIASIRWNSHVSIINTNSTERFQAANARRADAGEHPGMRDENRPKIAGDFMGVQYVKQKWSTKNRQLEFTK